MEWPIYFRDALIVGNPKSNIAVCTLWTRKENISKLIPLHKVAVIGNLYTVNGINYIIKNILANPVIRYIIVCGTDLNNVFEVLRKLWMNGVDENNRIKGTTYYLHKNIPRELIDTIRENVKLIDMRGRESELPKLIEELYREEGYFVSPIIIGEEKAEVELPPTDYTGYRIEGSLGEVWLNAIDLVMKYGEIKESEYGVKQKELLNVMGVIKSFEFKDYFNIRLDDLKRYYRAFFGDKQGGIEYTYGERLFKYHVPMIAKHGREIGRIIDQVDLVVKKLREKPYTRRAIAITWKAWSDPFSKNPPCLTQVIWNIKFNKLYQTCIFRSHDIYSAYLLNAYGLRKLQEIVAKRIEVELGDLVILSVSAHIYEYDWSNAIKLVNRYLGQRTFKLDPLGYFIIRVENGKIKVQHYTADGRKTKYFFEGTKAEKLYRAILGQNLISLLDHAAYLGKELGKAELCLRLGIKYSQDS